MLDRTKPPVIGRISHVNLLKAKSIFLSNGLPVHIIDAGQHDIIRLEIILKSGKWYENQNGVAYFTSQMMLEGTTHMTSSEIANFFDFNGAHVTMHSGIDFNILEVYVRDTKFSEIVQIIKDCLLNAAIPENELTILKDIHKQQLRINREKSSFLAGREIRKLLFGREHPYGRALEIDDINQDLNQGLIEKYYKNDLLSGLEIIISGKINDLLLANLEAFNDLPDLPSRKVSHEITGDKNEEVLISKGNMLQSSLRLGKKIIPKMHRDFTGLIVLNELFGGFFGSRLMKNIREDKGYTYGIHSTIINHLNGSFWMIGTDVKKEFVQDTIDQIYYEADRLRNEPVGSEELMLVKNYLMGNFLSSLETSFALADKFKNTYFFGLDYSFYDRYIRTINTITSNDIYTLADRYLNMSEFKRAIVG
jgi:predicted Zn-dependent peptidase